jgi:hypothetical protein
MESGRNKTRPFGAPAMSHIVTVKPQARDAQAIATACARLHLPAPAHGAARLFKGEATGLIVKLPGWLYPVVIDTASGEIGFDNYSGAWGEEAQLDRFKQAYAVEKSTAPRCTPC